MAGDAAAVGAVRRVGLQRPILIVMAGMVALLVAGIVVALVAGHRSEATYPANSPQRVVATYLRLLQAGRLDEAYNMTSITEPGGPHMSRARFDEAYGQWNQRSHRVTLLRVSKKGNAASVTVEIAAFSANLFGGSDETTQQTLTLERRRGVWRVTGPTYLYP